MLAQREMIHESVAERPTKGQVGEIDPGFPSYLHPTFSWVTTTK
jgi:hypothetical protein